MTDIGEPILLPGPFAGLKWIMMMWRLLLRLLAQLSLNPTEILIGDVMQAAPALVGMRSMSSMGMARLPGMDI